MAKEVSGKRLALVVVLTKDGNNPVEVTCRADYEVTSDGVSESRQLEDIELTSQEEKQIKNFIMNVVRPKVEAKESGN